MLMQMIHLFIVADRAVSGFCNIPRVELTLMCTPVSVQGNSQQKNKENDLMGYVRKVASWFPD